MRTDDEAYEALVRVFGSEVHEWPDLAEALLKHFQKSTQDVAVGAKVEDPEKE